jgi:hypothetical protein
MTVEDWGVGFADFKIPIHNHNRQSSVANPVSQISIPAMANRQFHFTSVKLTLIFSRVKTRSHRADL